MKKRSIISTALALIMILSTVLCAFSINAYAENLGPGTYEVTATSLSMRSEPTVATDNRVAFIPGGTQLIVTRISGSWGYTSYQSKYGWVSMNYLEFVSYDLKVAKKYGVVNCGALNLRSGPSTSYAKVDILYEGDVVEILEEKNGWSHVDLVLDYYVLKSKTGWVNSRYLDEYDGKVEDTDKVVESTKYDTYTTKTSTSLRTGYDSTFNVRTTVPSKTTLVVKRIKGSYALTVYNGMLGWVAVSDLKLNSGDKKEFPEVDRTNTKFIAGDGAAYGFGIDVSKWQGDNINWEKVKAAGVDFVIMRLGTTKGKDSRFETYYKDAKAAGLDVGGYIYTYAKTVDEAKKDADLCLEWLKGKTMEYPIYYDIEDPDSQEANSKEYNTQMARAFVDRMSAQGWYCGVYASMSWWQYELDYNALADKYESWVARYYNNQPSGKVDYASEYGMYQYSSTGRVDGIPVDVDLDVVYKDYPTIIKNGGYNGYTASNVDNNTDKGEVTTDDITDNTTDTTDTQINVETYDTYTVKTATSLRTGYNSTFNVRTTVPKGTTLVVKRIKTDYALTVYNGMLGWVSVKDITKNSGAKKAFPEVDRTNAKFIAGDGAAYAFGIDVSKWQGTINWEKVKAAGVDFVIIRLGTSKGKDSKLEEYYQGAKAVGLDVGGYIYSYSNTVAGAVKDAELCLKWLEGKTMEYPIYYDIEDPDAHANNTKDFNTKLVEAYLQTMTAKGWYCGVYTGALWFGTLVDYDKLADKYDSWAARYYNNTPSGKYDYASQFGMYQYSCTGRIGGINADVDLDVAYKDYPSIIKNGGYNGYTTSDNRHGSTDKVFGDATNDTVVNMEDVVRMQKAIAKLVTLTGSEMSLADVDYDGQLSMDDVVSVQQYIVGLKEEFAIG